MVAEQDAAFQGAAERADALGAIRAEEDVAVAVAPEVGVDHEERRHHAEALDTVELILAHGLAVDDDVPGVGAGIALLRLFIGIQNELDGFIAVAVDGDLPALLM